MNPHYSGKTEAELEALKTDRVRAIRVIEDDIEDINEELERVVQARRIQSQVDAANRILSPAARKAFIAGAAASAELNAEAGGV